MPLPSRSYDRTLNAELERLIFQIQVIKQEGEGLLYGLTEPQLHWNPAPGSWSIALCVDHLNVTNRHFAANFEKAVPGAKAANLLDEGPYVYGFLSRMFMRMVEPPPKMKVKAPKRFQPGTPGTREELMAEFFAQHDRLIGIMKDVNGLDLARIKVPSPVADWLKFPMGMMFWIVSAHNRRHLWQMRRIRQSPVFPN